MSLQRNIKCEFSAGNSGFPFENIETEYWKNPAKIPAQVHKEDQSPAWLHNGLN